MEIIDSQVHIVDEDKPERPWDPKFGAAAGIAASATRKHFTKGAALTTDVKMLEAMDATGVNGALLVATSHYGWDNSYSVEAAEKAPDRFRVIGRIDNEAEDVDAQIAAWSKNPVAVGLRLLFLSDAVQERFNAGYFDTYLRAAQRHNVPVCIFPPGYLREVASIARRYKDLQIVIDHIGLPQPPLMETPPDKFESLPDLLRLARFKNVSVKLSALPALSSEGFPFVDIWPQIHRIIDKFGPDRLMWGSDWTRVESLFSYSEGLRYITETSELSKADKEKILGQTARTIFDWPAS